MDNEDAVKIHYTTSGIRVFNPMGFAKIEMPDHKEMTWAEKKRLDLIWKLKNNIAKKNKIKRIVLKIISTILILAGTGVLVYFSALYHAQIGIQLGIITGLSTIIVHLKIETMFETNPNYIYPKRKNKTYY